MDDVFEFHHISDFSILHNGTGIPEFPSFVVSIFHILLPAIDREFEFRSFRFFVSGEKNVEIGISVSKIASSK